jgi:hypothetical protein
MTLGGLNVLVTQPATVCTYSVSQTQISAPATGTSGTVTVTTSCPVVASSSANWLTATVSGLSVTYTVAANLGSSQRSASLTIGTQSVSVVQVGMAVQNYAISGNITTSGSGLGGVTVGLSGSQSGSATTDSTGNYTFAGLGAGGNYTVTPSLGGYTFAPPSQTFSSLVANQTANFSAASTTAVGLDFYPVTPCRIADTRGAAGFTGQFGPPSMAGGATRTFNIPSSSCGIPATAVAYSLNFTVVPPAGGPQANLTTWPATDAECFDLELRWQRSSQCGHCARRHECLD